MSSKRHEYFNAGVRLVWFVEPTGRRVEVFTAPDQSTALHEGQTLRGGDVLPGFALSLHDVFAELDRQGNG